MDKQSHFKIGDQISSVQEQSSTLNDTDQANMPEGSSKEKENDDNLV
jgi:hypothetical protein